MIREPAELAPHNNVAATFGAIGFLSIYFALLFVLSAQLVVPGMGALGSPANLLGIFAFCWWVAATLAGQREFVGPNPIRTALFCYLAVVLLTWTLGKTRPLSAIQATESDRAILTLLSLAGVALVAMDGIKSRAEVEKLVRWMMGCAMVMVFVGLVQFFLDFDLSISFRPPGLEFNADAHIIEKRSSFNRPHGTALHPIEFGVVSAALVPMAYWMARIRRTAIGYIPLAAVAVAAMTSLSRSAVLAAAVVGLALLAGSSWKHRIVMVVTSGIFVIVVDTLVDGLVGALESLFTSAGTDPSVLARIDRIPRVLQLISEHPLLGRGFGTFTIEDDFLLDNEIQKTMIETGYIGAATLVAFIFFVAIIAWSTRVGDEAARLPGMALVGTILGLFISSYTFDAFFYRILTGVLYVCIGLVGALYRIGAAERAAANDRAAPTRSVAEPPSTTHFEELVDR